MRYIDVHTHLHDKAFSGDREAILSRMEELSIGGITVGTDIDTSREAIALSETKDFLWASVGQHPVDTTHTFDLEAFNTLAEHPKVVAIGECGLDYFRGVLPEEKIRQKKLFSDHITIASEVGKPLMIHGRPSKDSMDAYDDILSTLDATSGKHTGIVHFFSGNKNIAQKFIERGFGFSFGGVLTFTQSYDDVLRFIPLENILSETDSPYATPAPHRGKRNDSTLVPLVVARIALLKGLPEAEVENALVANARRIFGLA